ncbi:hypothetical protein ASD38_08235 [Caulobacter sp. Root487D2Y]|uniref:VOC family protein n=1 Tax=Caulobacter sp. Root487D2Y TaxID=1736547 RepID=UPI000700F99A|nr:VOC family protein [Caulobacter sp. Root487D2Y]KQY29335.1 hypothetical protein ASD38_08235 [Caulobacter sp. Root487D2Y]
MRPRLTLSALALTLGLGSLGLGPPAAQAAAPAPVDKLDHALLWGRDIDQASAVLAVKLGFQVRPGRNPGGVANRYVRLADQGYLELLGITRPNPELDPGMQADQASLHGGSGARAFGLHASALDKAQADLKAQGLPVTPIFTAAADDPDGQGPGKPPRWRLFAFERPVLSSSVFLIDYAAPRSDPVSVADDKAARQHPNGARSLSAFWLLSADASADKAKLEKLGLAGAVPVRVPQVAAKGYCVAVGPNALLALEPDGPGIAADALREGGPQVLGVSLGVADLDAAKRRVERGYEQSLAGYDGLSGAAFLAPTRADLGLLIEFHAASAKGPCEGVKG